MTLEDLRQRTVLLDLMKFSLILEISPISPATKTKGTEQNEAIALKLKRSTSHLSFANYVSLPH